MSTALSTTQQAITTSMDTTQAASMFTTLVLNNDLSKLSEPQRVEYYKLVCERVGLDPVTKPFDLITLQGKLVLYANKGVTAQLTASRNLRVEIVSKEIINGLYCVTARATKPDGASTEDIGAVTIGGLTGDAAANAMMKAITKAKRRAVLSVCGLGMMDESEVETIPAHQVEPAQLPKAAVTPELSDEDKDAIETWKDTIAGAGNAEELTAVVKGLKEASVVIRDNVGEPLKLRAVELGITWKGGQYVQKS